MITQFTILFILHLYLKLRDYSVYIYVHFINAVPKKVGVF